MVFSLYASLISVPCSAPLSQTMNALRQTHPRCSNTRTLHVSSREDGGLSGKLASRFLPLLGEGQHVREVNETGISDGQECRDAS